MTDVVFVVNYRNPITNFIEGDFGFYKSKEAAISLLKEHTKKYASNSNRYFTLTSDLMEDESTTDEEIINFHENERVFIQLNWDWQKGSFFNKNTGEEY